MEIEEFNFERFENRNARIDDRITIRKSYSIGFPTEFYKTQGLADYNSAELYYDKKRLAVGICFLREPIKENAFSIIRSKKGYGASVVARSFFKTYGINPEKYRGRYSWEKHTLEGARELFVIELREKKVEE